LKLCCVVLDELAVNENVSYHPEYDEVEDFGASVSKPHFMHNNNHVIIFYNPPHLLKNMHNNLKKLGLKVGEQCCFILL